MINLQIEIMDMEEKPLEVYDRGFISIPRVGEFIMDNKGGNWVVVEVRHLTEMRMHYVSVHCESVGGIGNG